MSSPFSKNRGPVLKVSRDTHDLSFQNNLTMKFGYLYPCMCKEVSAGDTWHVSPAFGLRFMPTFFPLQTKIKAKIDFFYVRNRNLFKDWMNWRFQTGSPSSFPVLSSAEKLEQSKTGSLGDYLGLPSTIVSSSVNVFSGVEVPPSSRSFFNGELQIDSDNFMVNDAGGSVTSSYFCVFTTPDHSGSFGNADASTFPVVSNRKAPTSATTSTTIPSSFVRSNFKVNDISLFYSQNINGSGPLFRATYSNNAFHLTVTSIYVDSEGYICVNPSISFSGSFLGYVSKKTESTPPTGPFLTPNVVKSLIGTQVSVSPSTAFNVVEATSLLGDISYDISALPFRAYENIYNAFYRDDRNNPYLIKGIYDPNKFLPSTDGGIDTNEYRLRRRNWEQDFLTSAVPNPQFGNAPLVGIQSVSSSGVATISVGDESYSTKLQYDENDKITGFSATPSSTANSKLINLASSGISINDLRAVNSLQKYFELHYRRGLRYRDQMMSHRGIEIGYDELDMPEFIGSAVQNVDVSQINQSVNSSDDPLGSYAGQLSAVGGSDRMSKYCDEDGIIMGIISIVPVPCYSQLLPKLFTKVNDPLEYFDPSFRNLGYQAIPIREVCPLQALNQGVSLDSTYGYNRAWYDYLQSTDEVHGLFRTSLSNFVMSRVFNSIPSLNPDFLTVDGSQINDVFSVSEVELPDGTKSYIDPILGQIHFDISVERQIPAYAIPSL